MYKTRFFSLSVEIEKVEVERETEHSVWIDGRKLAKMSSYYSFFKTFEEAKKFLLKNADNRIEIAKSELVRYEDEKRKIEALCEK